MRVVFLDPSGQLGGAETVLLDMLAGLRRVRPEWHLGVVAGSDGPLAARADALGVDAAVLPFPQALAGLGEWGFRQSAFHRLRLALALARAAAPAAAYRRSLRRRLRSAAPQIVHTNGLKMHLLGSGAAPRGAKLVWHLHDYPDARPVSASLLRRRFSRCDAVIANSDSVAERARALFGAGSSVHTVTNAIDLERYSPDGNTLDLDRAAGMPPAPARTVRIGLVATYARWKGHDVFLKALARMTHDVPVRGYVIGGPIYATPQSQYSIDELRAVAHAQGLADAVGFVGFIDDVPAAMRSLDIVVHASVEPEPFGLVAAQAMACGRSLIASRAGGVVEVGHGAAVFHAPGDPEDLAAQLSRLAHDPNLRAQLGADGRRLAEERFSRARMAAALAHLYESLA